VARQLFKDYCFLEVPHPPAVHRKWNMCARFRNICPDGCTQGSLVLQR